MAARGEKNFMFGSKDVVSRDSGSVARSRRRHSAPVLVGAVALCAGLFGGASSAWAGVGFSIVPSVTPQVTVGTTVPGALTIQNASGNFVAGETGYDTDSFQLDDITYVPSCGSQVSSANCPVGSYDPGVLVPSPLTATGRAGTACAGRTFTLVPDNTFPQGQYHFNPDQAIVLGPSSGTLAVRSCVIDFFLDVVRLPAIDSDPQAGLQTDQKAHTDGHDITQGQNLNQTGGGTGTVQTTVKAQPTIATVASQPLTLTAGSLSDQATVSGLMQPTGPGTVEFRLYGPNDATCATAIFTSSNRPLTLNGAQTVGTAQSASFTPSAAGDYRWRAFYSGDANNLPVNGPCNAANETTTVSPPPTTPPPPPPPPPPSTTPPPPPPAVPCTEAPGPAPPGGKICTTPPEVCTTPPGPAPAGGELCARGVAAVRGKTGCQGTPFRVTVSGRQIERVIYTLDSKTIKVLSKPNRGSLWVLSVNPRTLSSGVHRVLARTTFRKQSGTKARTLRVTFSRCARRATSPAFTG
jgi:hypothetical protein